MTFRTRRSEKPLRSRGLNENRPALVAPGEVTRRSKTQLRRVGEGSAFWLQRAAILLWGLTEVTLVRKRHKQTDGEIHKSALVGEHDILLSCEGMTYKSELLDVPKMFHPDAHGPCVQ